MDASPIRKEKVADSKIGYLSNNADDGHENVSLKEFALLQTLSRLFHFVYFVKCWQMLLELNSKVLCRPRQNDNLGTFTL